MGGGRGGRERGGEGMDRGVPIGGIIKAEKVYSVFLEARG